jgi:excisionase family DNA binding protein
VSNLSKLSTEEEVEWLRSGEAARFLGISRNTLKRLVKKGLVKAYRIKGVTGILFKRNELAALIEEVNPEEFEFEQE